MTVEERDNQTWRSIKAVDEAFKQRLESIKAQPWDEVLKQETDPDVIKDLKANRATSKSMAANRFSIDQYNSAFSEERRKLPAFGLLKTKKAFDERLVKYDAVEAKWKEIYEARMKAAKTPYSKALYQKQLNTINRLHAQNRIYGMREMRENLK